MADAQLRVAHRLLDQVFTAHDQIREPSAVGPLGHCLVLDPAAGLCTIELLRRERPQLLIRLEKLQLTVAHLQRLAMPLAELLGEPDRMLFGIEHVESVDRRVDSRSTWEIVLGEDSQLDRLGLDPQRLGRERAADLQRLLVIAAGRENALAPGWRLDDRVFNSLPFHANALDPEVILRLDLEIEHLGIKNDFLPRQSLACERRGLIFPAVDREHERGLALQPEAVSPSKLERSHTVNLRERARDPVPLGLASLAINLGA